MFPAPVFPIIMDRNDKVCLSGGHPKLCTQSVLSHFSLALPRDSTGKIFYKGSYRWGKKHLMRAPHYIFALPKPHVTCLVIADSSESQRQGNEGLYYNKEWRPSLIH